MCSMNKKFYFHIISRASIILTSRANVVYKLAVNKTKEASDASFPVHSKVMNKYYQQANAEKNMT